jgi:hypothetical protein
VSPFVSIIPTAKASFLYGSMGSGSKTVSDFTLGAESLIEKDSNRKQTNFNFFRLYDIIKWLIIRVKCKTDSSV